MPNATVVVVDDDLDTLEMLNLGLTSAGYRTTLCSEAEDAYPLIRRTHPRLVLLDFVMAGPEAGWRMLLLLRRDPRTADIPVVMCSGNDDFLRIRARLLRLQHCALLDKPFRLDDLLAKVETALSPP